MQIMTGIILLYMPVRHIKHADMSKPIHVYNASPPLYKICIYMNFSTFPLLSLSLSLSLSLCRYGSSKLHELTGMSFETGDRKKKRQGKVWDPLCTQCTIQPYLQALLHVHANVASDYL